MNQSSLSLKENTKVNEPGLLTPVAFSPLPFEGTTTTSTSKVSSQSPRSSVPMISMIDTPRYDGKVPTVEEINALSQEIAKLFPTSVQPSLQLPTQLPVQFPSQLPVQFPSVQMQLPVQFPSVQMQLPTQLPSVQPYTQLPSVQPYTQLPSAQLPTQLPSVQPYTQLPLVQLPSVQPYTHLPTQLPSAQLPSVQLPSVQLPTVGQKLPTVTFPNLSTLDLSVFGSLESFVPTMLSDNEIGDLRWNRPNPPRPIEITSFYRRVGCIGDGNCFFHAVAKGLSEIYQLTYRIHNNISESTLRKFESSINNVITFPSTLFTTVRSHNLEQVYTFAQPYGQNAFNNLMSQYRLAYVRMLRQDFAYQVLHEERMQLLVRKRLHGSIELQEQAIDADAKERGQILSREQVEIQAFQNVLRDLANELLSGNAVQPDFMLLLSDFSNVDIYLLRDEDLIDSNPRTTPLYSGASLHESVYGPIDMRPEGDKYARNPNRRAIIIISIDDFHYEIVARVDGPEGNERIRDINPNMSQEEPIVRRLYEMLVNLRYSV